MIQNPKDFFQQIQNLCEEVALKVKAISDSLSSFLTKSEAENAYISKTTAASTYLKKTDKAESAKTADSATFADSATKATQDGDGNVISGTYLKNSDAGTTYLSKTDASSTYLGKTAKAASATIADSATKATQDGNGKNIANTYATIASLTTTNTNVTNAQTTANQAKSSADAKVAISGNRGQLAGYETSGTATVIDADSPDSNEANTDVTVANGATGTAWTKVVRITAAVTVTLGGGWEWVGREVPTVTAGGVLVLCWCGNGGVANFVSLD